MKNTVNTWIEQIRQDHRRKLTLAMALAALALIVAGVVFWQLHATGVAMTNEVFCGMEEHVHDEGCYEQVLVCGQEESEGHTHTDACYENILTCRIPEHTHTVECLMDETADVETAADWEATLPDHLSGTWSDDVAAIAASQVGYTESTSNFILADDGETHMGYTRYGAWYGNAYGDWDAMFAAFCLNYAGVPEDLVPENSGARALSVALDGSGLYVNAENFTPETGDLAFFDTDGDGQPDRVGVITNVGDESLTVIEGDCGDAVAENSYDPHSGGIIAYGILPDQPGAAENVTYTAGSDGVEVSVTVPSDALPEDAQLQVVLYDEDSEEYARALSLTENAADADTDADADADADEEVSTLSDPGAADTDEEYEEEEAEEAEEIPLSFSLVDPEDIESGTAVLDIFFLSGGAEVEPDSSADVTIDASGLLDACENPVESLEVWHLAETEDGTAPVLVADISDPETAADGIAAFTVDSFSEFEFHYTCSAGGWAGFGTNLLDEDGNTISATVSGTYYIPDTAGRYDAVVDMPHEIVLAQFAEYAFTLNGSYDFLYATVTDPNYGDEEHTFDGWPGEEQVGANELYGSEENPVVSVTIDGTAATENPNYGNETVNSRTWHFTLTYADETSVTIPIYGNQDGGYDSGNKYSPKYLELNLYFKAGKKVVLNLGNGNGTNSDGDYTGSSSSSGDALRYGTGNLNDYADSDGKVTVNLPSDGDLAEENDVTVPFTVVEETGELPAVTVYLGKEQAYDYKLIGWINIATGDYYDVSNGSTTAEVDLDNDNVFYADWIAASYDHGSAEDEDLRDDTVSTKSFVTFDLFDYNELFDLYSASLVQNGTTSESWTDSGYIYSEPLLGNTGLTPMTDSFIFQNNGTTYSNVHVLSHANPVRWNLWTSNSVWANYDEYNFVLDANKYWGITDPDSTVLGMLYDKDEESLGVHYVGEGDYLFWIDDDGYYTYDSAVSGAAYNQTDGRFYVYEDPANAFFPYNDHTDNRTSSNGLTDYWFGMGMEVQFYLPSDTASGSEADPVNQINGKDMIFDFSGDDDIMIFVDDKMVVDMAGIHSTSYSRINFSTNTVTYSMGLDSTGAPNTDSRYSYKNDLDLSAGFHTLTVRYMERGASASNLKIQFNVAPTWEYDSWPVQTVTAEKVWKDSSGNVIEDPTTISDVYSSVEVGLFDALGPEKKAEEDDPDSDDVFGYTKGEDSGGNTTYTVTYEDTDKTKHVYVYTVYAEGSDPGASLTYTEYDENNIQTESETYNNTDDEGRVVDNSGYVIAWLAEAEEDEDEEDDLLHIRVDQKTLDKSNDWSYAWELLDADGDYEVLELSGSSSYVTTSKKDDDLTTYDYWSIIGETEIEESLGDDSFSVILTEAAQEANNTLGDTQEALGWVIVVTEDGELTTKQVKFSHIAQMFEVTTNGEEEGEPDIKSYYSLLGVTSKSEIDALGSGAVWYLVDSRDEMKDIGNAKEFYLYCLIGGDRYYLALDDDGDSLIVTTEAEKAGLFYYDFLGELRIVREADDDEDKAYDRVVIAADGTISLAKAEEWADEDDVRFYTLKETETTGFSFTAVNTFLPDITLEKVDSVTGEPVSGVTFTLTNDSNGLHYGYFDDIKDETIWLTDLAYVYTDVNGQIIFHYLPDGEYTLTEVTAADGYNLLPSAITIIIKDGEITSAKWTDDDLNKEDSPYYGFITISGNSEGDPDDPDEESRMVRITLENQPGVELPSAGGTGTTMLYVIGAVIAAGAAAVLIVRRRRAV